VGMYKSFVHAGSLNRHIATIHSGEETMNKCLDSCVGGLEKEFLNELDIKEHLQTQNLGFDLNNPWS
jgi:hypothetical protein